MEGNRVLNVRQQEILDYINVNGNASIRDFIGIYEVSEATIRRDFDELAKSGFIDRIHGGAVRANSTAFVPVHSEKMGRRLGEKKRIAAYAASLVQNGESIFLDSGTTANSIAMELANHKDLVIITNNLDIVRTVQFDPSVSLIVTGGVRNDQYSALVGTIAEQVISSFHVDKAFMGCDAIDPENGVYNANFPAVGVKRCIANCGKKIILAADSSKFYVKALAKVCDLKEIDVIITDTGLDEKTHQTIRKQVPNTICV